MTERVTKAHSHPGSFMKVRAWPFFFFFFIIFPGDSHAEHSLKTTELVSLKGLYQIVEHLEAMELFRVEVSSCVGLKVVQFPGCYVKE